MSIASLAGLRHDVDKPKEQTIQSPEATKAVRHLFSSAAPCLCPWMALVFDNTSSSCPNSVRGNFVDRPGDLVGTVLGGGHRAGMNVCSQYFG